MELWIRSQDKKRLEKSTGFHIVMASKNEFDIVNSYMTIMGRYKTKEKALEVLDEIQSKLKATFLMKPKNDNYSKYVEDGKRYLEELNDISIVTGDRCFNLEPINSDVYVYEMPKE